jgi:hypothetical protein
VAIALVLLIVLGGLGVLLLFAVPLIGAALLLAAVIGAAMAAAGVLSRTTENLGDGHDPPPAPHLPGPSDSEL